jgi:hypothetical protein
MIKRLQRIHAQREASERYYMAFAYAAPFIAVIVSCVFAYFR